MSNLKYRSTSSTVTASEPRCSPLSMATMPPWRSASATAKSRPSLIAVDCAVLPRVTPISRTTATNLCRRISRSMSREAPRSVSEDVFLLEDSHQSTTSITYMSCWSSIASWLRVDDDRGVRFVDDRRSGHQVP